MKLRKLICLVFMLGLLIAGECQILYVDAAKGDDTYSGQKDEPLLSIQQAVKLAEKFDGRERITIKVLPGLYILNQQVEIDSLPVPDDTTLLSIEAAVMPGDTGWRPDLMPVIQSISNNNKNYGNFNHCIGFEVERSHVAIRGLKFTGNSNPGVGYYYTIERHQPYMEDLQISNCLFVGEQHISPIQGAIFAQGQGIKVDYCTFYNCKNVILCFLNVKKFSFLHSIIYGSYEAAIRLGYGTEDGDLVFSFSYNIIAGCEYVWLGYKEAHSNYAFDNAVFTGNKHLMGYNTATAEEDTVSPLHEKNVVHDGTILFDGALRLTPASVGYGLGAGYARR